MQEYILSLIVFLPLLGTAVLLLLNKQRNGIYHWINLLFSSVNLGLIAYLTVTNYSKLFSSEKYGDLAISQKFEWFRFSAGNFGEVAIDYFLGLDGMNFPLILLSGIILFIAAIFSFEISYRVRGYTALFQLISTAIMGSFMALDFFLFYLFFEFMLLPMFFLIGIWGGPRKEYASIKFFIFTLLGSLLILAAMIMLNISTYDTIKSASNSLDFINSDLVHGFNFFELSNLDTILAGSPLDPENHTLLFGFELRYIAFWAVFIGFIIKLPGVPFHTWLPDAHVEAPTPVSIILASLLLKIGAYGIFRIAAPMFADVYVESLNTIAILAVISIIYGGLNALAMRDFKKMIAYSSISHMGFVLLGCAAFNTEGFVGANIQMVSHGLISAMLFILAGVIYKRTGSRDILDFGGLNFKMPVYTTLALITFLAAMGLPGFSGFIAELMILLGAFSSSAQGNFSIWISALSAFGIFITAAYFIWTMQRMFFGPFMLRNLEWKSQIYDLKFYEKYSLITLALLSLLIGLYPTILTAALELNLGAMIAFMNEFL